MNTTPLSPPKKVEILFDLYEHHGHEDYIGEPVSQLEHMCQAAQLAEKEGYDEEVILAAFFHDIGHLICHLEETESMDGYGVKSHEQHGADFLRQLGFSKKITLLVENHVQAKRYLTFSNPAYLDLLSEASKKTLAYQGGPMHAEEARLFEKDEFFEPSLRMRYWDDEAKLTHIPLPDLNYYKEMALNHLILNEKTDQ